MLSDHCDVQLTVEEIVADFATQHPCRILLTDLFN